MSRRFRKAGCRARLPRRRGRHPTRSHHQLPARQQDGSGEGSPAVTSGRSGHDLAGGLDRLRRQYPRLRIWRGQATGDYWALPPRDHPTQRELIAADDLNELARRLAQAEGQHDR